MKALKYLLVFVLAIAAFITGLGLFGKKQYHIERSELIQAPMATVKEKVSTWKNFPAWSPWQPLDPAMHTSIEGTDGTVGAKYIWKGNDKVGTGSQTFKAITENQVDIDVQFTEPWASEMPTSIKLAQKPEGVQVSWGCDLKLPFPWNAFAMFTDMDKAIGKDYADGLTRLKALCEGEVKLIQDLKNTVKAVQVPTQNYVGIRKKMPMSEMQGFFGPTVATLMAGIPADQIMGGPASLYYVWDEATKTTDMVVAVPVKQKIAKLTTGAPAENYTLGGNAAEIEFTGSYEQLGFAHLAVDKYLAEQKATPSEPVLEMYMNSPETEKDPNKMVTKIRYFYPAAVAAVQNK
jgi:effector-binding domain-containing protein